MARVSRGARRLNPLADRPQRGVLVTSAGRISRLPGPVPAFGSGAQDVPVLGILDPLADGQQDGELVSGSRRISRASGPGGEVVAGGQGVEVLGTQDPLVNGQQAGGQVSCRGPGRAAGNCPRRTERSVSPESAEEDCPRALRFGRETVERSGSRQLIAPCGYCWRPARNQFRRRINARVWLTETARLRARYGLCGAWPAGYGARVTSCRSCR